MSRFISKPEAGDLRRAKRLGRYLQENSMMVFKYGLQDLPNTVVVWSDTGFAGCRRPRRSTSGGLVMFGSCCMKAYSSTQDITSLSSGEAEFYGSVRAGMGSEWSDCVEI